MECKKKENRFFKETCFDEFIEIPSQHPNVEQVISAVVECEIVAIKAINTMQGRSYEGQYLSGKKIVIELKLHQKILYSAEKSAQAIHIIENECYQSIFIVIPRLIEGTDPAVLIEQNLLKCKIEVEDICLKKINSRTIHKSLNILAFVYISPTYELCLSVHRCSQHILSITHADGGHSSEICAVIDKENHYPVWSPLGREIAYTTCSSEESKIYIYSIKMCISRHIELPLKFTSVKNLCWSPDGSRIIFSGFDKKTFELYSVNCNSMDFKQITNGRGIFNYLSPKISGCKIICLRESKGLYDLWMTNLEGNLIEPLTECIQIGGFSCQTHGDTMAIIEKGKGDITNSILIYDLPSKNIKPLEINLQLIRKIKYSPDGSKLAIIGTSCGLENLYIYSFENNDFYNISEYHHPVSLQDFVWNADSDKIYYSAKEQTNMCLLDISLDNREKQYLFTTDAYKIEMNYRPKL